MVVDSLAGRLSEDDRTRLTGLQRCAAINHERQSMPIDEARSCRCCG